MKRYAPFRFRPAFALAAMALTAATLSLAVVVPAAVSPMATEATALAAHRMAPAAIEVTIIPARIDVIGMRDSESIAATPARETVRRTSFRS
jgi:hypothetical protein